MKRLIIFCVIYLPMAANAQVSDFKRAYDACVQINLGFDDGFAHNDALEDAAGILQSLQINVLPLQKIAGDEISLNGHIVFTPDFILDCIEDQSIYSMAAEYAKKHKSYRGSTLYMNTIPIKAESTAIYKIHNCQGLLNIGCVAETKGLFSWKLKIEDMKTKITEVYKDNVDEIKGRIARCEKIEGIYYSVTLEITNTTTADSSYAIIIE